MNEIPKIIYLHAEWSKYANAWRYTVSDDDDRSFIGEILIGRAEVEFEITLEEERMTNEQIKLLRKEQSSIRAESEKKCMEIEETIGQMLALPAPTKGEDDDSPF